MIVDYKKIESLGPERAILAELQSKADTVVGPNTNHSISDSSLFHYFIAKV